MLRLADDSFLHVSFHDHTDDEVNPISSTKAFAHFQDGHESRREGGVDQQTATSGGGLHHDHRLSRYLPDVEGRRHSPRAQVVLVALSILIGAPAAGCGPGTQETTPTDSRAWNRPPRLR